LQPVSATSQVKTKRPRKGGVFVSERKNINHEDTKTRRRQINSIFVGAEPPRRFSLDERAILNQSARGLASYGLQFSRTSLLVPRP
ncbi:MAG: hypothetical protein ACQESY_11395, partial [Pseudomonadota bacterium]